MPRPVIVEVPTGRGRKAEYRIPDGAAVARKLYPDAKIVAYDDGGLSPREPYKDEAAEAPAKTAAKAEKAS